MKIIWNLCYLFNEKKKKLNKEDVNDVASGNSNRDLWKAICYKLSNEVYIMIFLILSLLYKYYFNMPVNILINDILLLG